MLGGHPTFAQDCSFSSNITATTNNHYLQIFPTVVDRQFREPHPIKDNLFAELVSPHKSGQILQGIEFHRLSDYSITTRCRRTFYGSANEAKKSSTTTTSLSKNEKDVIDMLPAREPLKAFVQHYLHNFMEAIEWYYISLKILVFWCSFQVSLRLVRP